MTKSECFLLFCIFFISGIFFGSYLSIQIWILFLLVGFCISLVFLFDKNKKVRILFLLIIFLLLGFIRIESEKLNKQKIFKIENLNNQKLLLEGKVSQMPEIKNNKQKLILKDIKDIKNGNNIDGKIIIYTNKYPEYNIGNEINFKGTLKIPEDFNGFEYKNYLFSKKIYYVLYYPKIEVIETNNSKLYFQIMQLRKYENNLILKIFSQPQAGIISAMTLGIKSNINSETLEAFNKTGTRHIIAISGLHMTIVVVMLMSILLAIGLKRNHAFYFALGGIIFFVSLVGCPSSAIRAAIMGGLVLLAVKIGRLTSAGNAIIFAAVLMLLYDPNLLRYDVGFQLSFLAVLGIIYIYPKLDFHLKSYPDYWKIKTMLLITLSAQIATLPIIINNFGNFSLLSVFVNVLILPFVPIVMLGGFLIIIIGFINLFLAQTISWPIWLILTYQIEIIKFFARLNFGYLNFEKIGFLFFVIYYGILFLIIKHPKSIYILNPTIKLNDKKCKIF